MCAVDISPKSYMKRVLMYAGIFLLAAVIFAVLYAVVYVRCYNTVNPDDMIVFKVYNNSGDIFVVLFNKLYKL